MKKFASLLSLSLFLAPAIAMAEAPATPAAPAKAAPTAPVKAKADPAKPADATKPVDAGKPTEAKPAAEKIKLVDINTAPEADLIALPGVGEKYAKKIIEGRPYAKKDQLKSRKILPSGTYAKVQKLIIADQPADGGVAPVTPIKGKAMTAPTQAPSTATAPTQAPTAPAKAK